MSPKAIDGVEVTYRKWCDTKFNDIEEVPNYYFEYIINLHPAIKIYEEEMTEAEILNLPEKIGMFQFLDNEEENIYTESDGVPLE